jgi:hypothetical protein
VTVHVCVYFPAVEQLLSPTGPRKLAQSALVLQESTLIMGNWQSHWAGEHAAAPV